MTALRWLAVVSIVAAACAEAAMPVDEYFAAMGAAGAAFAEATADVDDRYTAQLGEVFEELQGRYDLTDAAQAEEFALRSVEVSIAATAGFVEAQTEAMERHLAALAELRPPEVAAEAHDASVDALRGARDGVAETLDRVRNVSGVGELEAAVGSSPVGEALVRIGEACRVLQAVAADEGLIVDLRCPDS